jgi:hypothetical protein
MKHYINSLAAATIALSVAAPAFANAQLIAAAGLTPAEAAGLSLTEIAQAKFNRDSRGQDAQQIVSGLSPAEAGASALNDAYVAKIFSEGGRDRVQGAVRGKGVTVASRSAVSGSDRAQLVAAAGLTPAEAAGMTLSEIAAAKFAGEGNFD